MIETATERAPDVQVGRRSCLTAAEEDRGIDLLEIYRALRRGSRRILAVTSIALGFAVLISFLVPVRYTSTTSFIPPNLSAGGSAAAALVGQLSPLGGSDLLGGMGKNSSDMYAGILKSRSIASNLVKRFNLMQVYRAKKESQAEKALQGDTTISADLKSSIVTLSFTAKDPQLAHDVASAYMDALRQTNGRLALSQASQRRVFFEEQLSKEKDELENAEVELKKTQETSGLIAPVGQTEAEIRTIAETQAQIAVRQVQLAALRQSATEQNPEVVRLRSEIENLQSQLQRLQKDNTQQNSLTIPTSRVPQVQLEYVRKQREVKYHEALFEMLSRQYEAARLDEAREAPLVQVLDEASYPDMKSSPKRLYFAIAGLLLGLIGGVGWVLVGDHLVH